MFGKVLVANRGEIAVRLVRGLRERGISSAVVYSDADRASLAVRLADEAIRIGPAPSSESYLSIEKVLDAARQCGADAIHPGYGFLSENADFAAACEAASITFIGPPADAIRKLGSKTEARKIALEAGAPIVPGVESGISTVAEARRVAREIGFPVILKAAAGGGGRGMRRVDREQDLEAALREASSEAERSFKSSEVYLEKLLPRPRHVEIQVLGDRHGHMIHLGERECSLQRRHQKVVEECPSPLMQARPGLRDAMGEAALKVARAAGYVNAGTCEFLVDEAGSFYFLEMNTRLQVEHPVTEMVTGVDLVDWQLRIAAGERLTLQQSDVQWNGWAMECRIYAEDADNGFLPCPGRVAQMREPSGPGIRIDSGVYPGWTVPFDYDPLLAKLAAWGSTREESVERLQRALSEYAIAGIATNLSFFRRVLSDAEFRAGRLHTGFIDEFLARSVPASGEDHLAGLAAAIAAVHASKMQRPKPVTAAGSRWRDGGLEDLLR